MKGTMVLWIWCKSHLNQKKKKLIATVGGDMCRQMPVIGFLMIYESPPHPPTDICPALLHRYTSSSTLIQMPRPALPLIYEMHIACFLPRVMGGTNPQV